MLTKAKTRVVKGERVVIWKLNERCVMEFRESRVLGLWHMKPFQFMVKLLLML